MLKTPHVRFEPSPPYVVDEMLRLAEVGPGDVVYDLGCGDGRMVVGAAALGARGVGVDVNPRRLEECRRNAARAGVTARVRFLQQDMFEVDLRKATVVLLYLLPSVNLRLRPKLEAELRSGARIVSNGHDIGDWLPTRTIRVRRSFLHIWCVS